MSMLFVSEPRSIHSPCGQTIPAHICNAFIFQENDIELAPPYLVASKEVVKEREKPRWVRRKNIPEVTMSWHNYMVKKVMQDFQV
jgi:hypothetical protein